MEQLLQFSPMAKNQKLKKIGNWSDDYIGYTFSLPSGYSCPGASECLSKADKHTGKITDGKESLYRCFSASTESMYKQTRNQRWHNFELLRSLDYQGMRELISKSIQTLPRNVNLIRIHVGGDFFNQAYFDAWVSVASEYQDITFYAYTKSIKYWVESQIYHWNILGLRSNLRLIASVGGKHDDLIETHSLYIRSARVVHSIEQAQELNLEIDYDERIAITSDQDFALLIHGNQPKQINNMVGVA